MEKAIMHDSSESKEFREKILGMLTAKGDSGRIHVRHAGNTAYVDEDIPSVDTLGAERQRLRLRVQLAQQI